MRADRRAEGLRRFQDRIRDTVRSFIEREVMPLEPDVLRNECAGRPRLDPGVQREMQRKARRIGI